MRIPLKPLFAKSVRSWVAPSFFRRELPRNEHTYDQTTIVMIPYLAQLEGNSAEIKPTEHIAVAWAKPEELLDYDLAAADLPVVTAFRQTHEPRS